MKHRISVGQYRAIDLSILTGVLIFSELLICLAVSRWFPAQLYVASPAAAVVTLVMMRWDAWAAVPALAGGIVYSLLYGGSAAQVAIYAVGNLAALLLVPVLRRVGKERVRGDAIYSLLLGLGVQLLMQGGRAVVALVLGFGTGAAIGFFTTDTLSILFTLVIVWIIRRVDGLFEDQMHYLLRIQDEEDEEK